MEDMTVNKDLQMDSTPRGSGSSLAMGFVLGALVGAGIALLTAPKTGKETRRRLADAGARWGNAARSRIDEAGEIAHDLKRDAQSAMQAGREAFQHGQNSHEPRPAPRTELSI
jgi:gas vesicle protein